MPRSKSSSLSLWNWFPACGELARCCHCCSDTCAQFTMPSDASGAPPPSLYLLHQSPLGVLLFRFVCAPKTLISRVQFRDGFVAPTMKCPRSSSTPVIGHFLSLCSYSPNESFIQSPTLVLFIVPCNTNWVILFSVILFCWCCSI